MSASIATVGFSELEDSFQAGFEAAKQASSAVGNHSGWKLAILFSTSRHDPMHLQEGVQSVIGRDCELIGGYGVGVITNDKLAYDGFQVGILLLSPSAKAVFDIFSEGGLANNEVSVGEKLAESISNHTFDTEEPSLLLLYDAVNRLSGRFKMNMATYVLEGIKQGIHNWPPNLVGAGLVGDMQCRETFQWCGGRLHQQAAIVLALSGSLRIDSAVMHGCRPASKYHQVTKSDGNVVLEIDGIPALDKISELLGPDSGKTWRDYSFFITLGVNRGEKFGAFKESDYANRLCMGVDPDRKGLVMFEPDLVPGSDIQLMRREVNYTYIEGQVEELLNSIQGRKPVFAIYIDCAGRAATYSGFDNEDAVGVQRALGDIPLLGLYAGVEIGAVAGEPMALDWTGVLAIVSEGDPAAAPHTNGSTPSISAAATADSELSADELDACIHDSEERIQALQSESDYYAGLSDELACKNLKMDSHLSALNHRLRTKEQGFALLAKLHDCFEQALSFEQLCRTTIQQINTALNMDKTMVLLEKGGAFCPAYWSGYAEADVFSLEHIHLSKEADWMQRGFLLGNRSSRNLLEVQQIRNMTRLPYFVCVTIREAGSIIGLMLCGRMKEVMPFYPPLDEEDASTLITTAAFLSATNQLNRQRQQLEQLSSLSAHADVHQLAGNPALNADGNAQQSVHEVEIDLLQDMDISEIRECIREARSEVETLKRSSEYYGSLADELAGQNVKKDSTLSMVNNELRIKKQGFAILSELQSRLQSQQTIDELCPMTIKTINETLKMDKSMVLFDHDGIFRPAFWSGFTEMEAYDIEDVEMPHEENWIEGGFLLANRRTSKDEAVIRARNFIPIPFFVAVPIRQEGKTIGLLVSGRLKEVKPFNPPLDKEDAYTFMAISGFLSAINQLNQQRANLEELNRTLELKVKERTADLSDALGELEVKNTFIRKTFGRYMSDEVVENILETPDGLNMGGQSLPVTIVFSDLRGFSAISESLSPEAVVDMLNIYLEEMTRIVFKYSGSINEFMGDGILIVFGAPTVRPDDVDHAIACAMEMQLAMDGVNARIKARGYPELDMGIGINTGHVIAGNVGSAMRSKYAVVGSNVNMAARVESFTVGGQVLATQSTLDAATSDVKVAAEFSTNFKGIKEPVVMHEITGIGGDYKLYLPETKIVYQCLHAPLPLSFEKVEGKTSSGEMHAGEIVSLSEKFGVLVSPIALELRSNLKISLSSNQVPDGAYVYAKVIKCHEDGTQEINFTYMTREVRKFLAHEKSIPPDSGE